MRGGCADGAWGDNDVERRGHQREKAHSDGEEMREKKERTSGGKQGNECLRSLASLVRTGLFQAAAAAARRLTRTKPPINLAPFPSSAPTRITFCLMIPLRLYPNSVRPDCRTSGTQNIAHRTTRKDYSQSISSAIRAAVADTGIRSSLPPYIPVSALGMYSSLLSMWQQYTSEQRGDLRMRTRNSGNVVETLHFLLNTG